MQDYADTQSTKTGDLRGLLDSGSSDYQKANTPLHQTPRAESTQYPGSSQQQQYSVGIMEQKPYGFSSKNITDLRMDHYCRDSMLNYEAGASSSQFQTPRFNNPNTSFCSPPNSPLVGLVFDPASQNYSGPTPSSSGESRSIATDHRGPWPAAAPDQILPIGTGARKKIMKSQPDRRCYYGEQHSHHDRYYSKTDPADGGIRKNDPNLTSESTSSLDFLGEGERMVSELCNISENPLSRDNVGAKPYHFVVAKDKCKSADSIEMMLRGCLDEILVHDQIPSEIVQLAIEACTEAENIAIAHHNRPCFKNIHSICAKTRSNVQKSDSAVANLHSQGIPWVIKNFIFSFVRILDGWKGVKELLCEKHDTFSRIENKYYSPNIRECFVQWQAVTKEMLNHIYKTFKCLDQGFAMEQKSFTHNYYASNPTAPRHQNQGKYLPPKVNTNPLRPTNAASQTYGGPSSHWFQNSSHLGNQHFADPSWPIRPTSSGCKKYPIIPTPGSHPLYPTNDQIDADNYQHKCHFKYEPGYLRESKPRQSWTITSVQEFRTVESMGRTEQRELYSHIKQKVDAELGKGSSCPALMEVKSKMIPLSHVEKTLIPSMASGGDARNCYVPKNNSCGDTKEESDFFTNWGQMLQKEPSQYATQQPHNIQVPSNVVSFSTNIVGPVQLVDPENDEMHDQSKVYMKPGSYKVPTKPSDPVSPFSQDSINVYDTTVDEIGAASLKVSLPAVTALPPTKYTIETWPCLLSKRHDDVSFSDEQKDASSPHLDLRGEPDECTVRLNCGPSDRAWEAAKQSAPKLLDFIHDESKSDTVRLYNALGLSGAPEDYYNQLKKYDGPFERETRSAESDSSSFSVGIWNQRDSQNVKEIVNPLIHQNIGSKSIARERPNVPEKYIGEENGDVKRSEIIEQQDNITAKEERGSKTKTIERPKVANSGVWYHPKRNKPIPSETSKKFERILDNLSEMNESSFIQNDMDMKSAPRFYEVVKYPMCLDDIGTKLRHASYTEADQVLSDFRRIFNNVRMYLKTYPDATMKKNVSKLSNEFEKMYAEEFSKCDTKGPAQQDDHAAAAATSENLSSGK